jgi:hypothetical protein
LEFDSSFDSNRTKNLCGSVCLQSPEDGGRQAIYRDAPGHQAQFGRVCHCQPKNPIKVHEKVQQWSTGKLGIRMDKSESLDETEVAGGVRPRPLRKSNAVVDVLDPRCCISCALFGVVSVKLKVHQKGTKSTAEGR